MADIPEKSVYYKRERRKFALITYLLTAIFLIVALLQWVLFSFVGILRLFFTLHYWVSCIFFGLGLVLLVFFIFFEALRFNKTVNWLFAVLIFECIVLGIAPLVARHYRYQFLFSFLIWTLALVIFILCGSFLPLDLTLDVVVLFVLAVVSIIGAIYFVMLYIVANVPYSFIIARAFIVISILMFVMYHAQIINGGRFAEMRTKDYFLAAIILFLDFLLLFLFSFQMAPKWSDLCDSEWKNNLVLFKETTTSRPILWWHTWTWSTEDSALKHSTEEYAP
ncbi:protein lifeguard 2 [Drosophila suzukii]|uniref:Protein lifeguard 2 n=1 Tax=Drosophila suzukii TaxID=28584 RepID=A0AB39ZUF4_DROSZ